MNEQVHVRSAIRVRDMERTRLAVWELKTLADEMTVASQGKGPINYYAQRIERVLSRFVNGGDDEGGGALVDG